MSGLPGLASLGRDLSDAHTAHLTRAGAEGPGPFSLACPMA